MKKGRDSFKVVTELIIIAIESISTQVFKCLDFTPHLIDA